MESCSVRSVHGSGIIAGNPGEAQAEKVGPDPAEDCTLKDADESDGGVDVVDQQGLSAREGPASLRSHAVGVAAPVPPLLLVCADAC